MRRLDDGLARWQFTFAWLLLLLVGVFIVTMLDRSGVL